MADDDDGVDVAADRGYGPFGTLLVRLNRDVQLRNAFRKCAHDVLNPLHLQQSQEDALYWRDSDDIDTAFEDENGPVAAADPAHVRGYDTVSQLNDPTDRG